MAIDYNLIPQDIVERLKEKGLDESSIEMEITNATQLGEKIFPGNSATYVKNRLNAKFASVLAQEDIKIYKAVYLGGGSILDDNRRMRDFSKSKAGNTYKDSKSGEDVVVKEGHFPWGFNIGKPIPETPDWKQEIIVLLQIGNKLELKTINLSGAWLKDEGAQTATPGDLLLLKLKDKDLERNAIFYNGSYKVEGAMPEENFKKVAEQNLAIYKKTIEQVLDENYRGFVVLEGAIGEYEPTSNGGAKVSFTDETSGFNPNAVVNSYIRNCDFIDGAVGITFIGNCYISNGKIGLTTYMHTTPEEFKVVQSAEANTIAEQAIEEEDQEEVIESEATDLMDGLL